MTLTSMLLNELQKQHGQLRDQIGENSRQTQQISRLSAKIAEVKASAERQLRAQHAAFEERLLQLERTFAAQRQNSNLAAEFNM